MFAKCLVSLVLILLTSPANAGSLRQQIDALEILPLRYGVNELTVNGKDALIIRGRFENGTAWDGDIYSVLIYENKLWHMARYDKAARSSVLTETLPHTEEDSVTTIRFMVPKKSAASQPTSSLYLLDATRDYMTSDTGKPDTSAAETKVTFSLYKLQRDEDFGVYYLRKISSEKTQAKYCNADWAAYKELNAPLPKNDVEYDCDTLNPKKP